MPSAYLSKSDFKMAHSCLTKLYYWKHRYPNTAQDDDYLKLMAEGGYMVGKMAQLLHPEGVTIPMDAGVARAFADTQAALAQENCTLFEPVILAGRKLVRVDIVIKRGNHVELIEVKSKSFDPENDDFMRKHGGVTAVWKPYIEDVAFQAAVLREAFPKLQVTPYLTLVNKTAPVDIDGLTAQFQLLDISTYEHEDFRSFAVEFTGDLADLKRNNFLIKLDASAAITHVEADVARTIAHMENAAEQDFAKEQVPLNVACKKCEFRKRGEHGRCGFDECWQEMAAVSPNIFDLYQFAKRKAECNILISNRSVRLEDIPEDMLHKDSGAYGARQRIQIAHSRSGTEWISDELHDLMAALPYPLHFIDFETARLPIPPHRNMTPYGNIAFQWSCHSIAAPGAPAQHSEWINTHDQHPNLTFAQILMEQLGYDGTVFMWADHENTVLRDIYHELARQRSDPHPELRRWLDYMTKKDKGDTPTMIDMCKLTLHHYFHPNMGGSTSIKYVLPAVWQNFPNLENHPLLSKYYREQDGTRTNPYELLPPLLIDGQEQVIADGTGAMRAYQEMMYGSERNNAEVRQQWTELLRQYCELDTAAMVAIWEYWGLSTAKR